MNDVNVNDYLTWEYCLDPDIQYLGCPPPAPIRTYLPQWVKELRGNIQEYLPEGFGQWPGQQKSVRHCLGFRGIANVGYTIPLPETLDGNFTYFARCFLHPEMLHGTKWANKTADNSAWITDTNLPFDSSPYEYRLQVLFWPWRARMSPGWRLLILPYTMDWSSDWHEFAGTVDPNYHVENGTGIGRGLTWSRAIDPKYNYYNIETVIASKRSVQVAKGTVIFCAVPLFDPELYTKQTGKTL
jgi:hypothetical protein